MICTRPVLQRINNSPCTISIITAAPQLIAGNSSSLRLVLHDQYVDFSTARWAGDRASKRPTASHHVWRSARLVHSFPAGSGSPRAIVALDQQRIRLKRFRCFEIFRMPILQKGGPSLLRNRFDYPFLALTRRIAYT